ncbi:hypothetical protein PM8797T_21063 [Gimesia maris DSM 8797]|nr:hypothetical protein PM8797T_21063 [Gimesia maris DSM 8797]
MSPPETHALKTFLLPGCFASHSYLPQSRRDSHSPLQTDDVSTGG